MLPSWLDAFGRLIVPPERLHREARVTVLRGLAGELQGGTPAAAWLGRVLAAWLHDGGSLESHLGVKAPRGSRRTAHALVSLTASNIGGASAENICRIV